MSGSPEGPDPASSLRGGLCAIVVAHGSLAKGLLSALERVAGPQTNIWAVSNDSLGRDELAAAIRQTIQRHADGRDALLFSDLGGGSCGHACRRLLAEGSARAVFFGANLPLLIEFVFLQDQPFDTLIAALLAKSRSALGYER